MRRKSMESQIKSVDLHAQRWNAVTWDRVAHGDFEDEYVKPQGICPEIKAMIADQKTAKGGFGTVGCYLSHLTALICEQAATIPRICSYDGRRCDY